MGRFIGLGGIQVEDYTLIVKIDSLPGSGEEEVPETFARAEARKALDPVEGYPDRMTESA